MTETFNQILDRHQLEVAEFRKKCKHAKTELREYFWAPGHSGGLVKCCKICNMQLESAHKPKTNNYATENIHSLVPSPRSTIYSRNWEIKPDGSGC